MKKLTLILGLVIVGLVIFIVTMDLNQYKPKIEQAVKDASGYDLKINGDISTSFSPVGISVADVSVAVPNQKPFATFKSFDVALELMPLLSQEVKVNYVVLSNLNLNIEKMKNGKTNFDVVAPKSSTKKEATSTKKEKEPTKLPLVNVTEVRLDNANITYVDNISNSKANVKNLNVTINDISLDSTKEKLKSIALRGDVKIAQITYDKYNIYNTTLDFDLKDAVANLNSMKYTIFDSQATAKARVDMSGKIPKISVEELIPNLKLENFSKEILEKDLLKGVVNAKANISFVGADELSAKKTAKGVILLDGQNVGVKGYDIDKIVKSYNDLKSGDLKKAGASFLSSAMDNASKGKGAFDDLKGGTTAINRLHVKIDISKKVATLSDVAIATVNNRVAIKGGINIVDESLKGVTVAILDKKGCASYSQKISGSLSDPKGKSLTSKDEVSQEEIQEVVNMVSSFFGKKKEKKAEKKSNENCKVFYTGIVKHP
jgi:AsmA protein